MIDLLKNFTPTQILLFVVGFALAIKGAWDLVDYFKEKYNKKFNKDYTQKKKEETLEEHYQKCINQHQESVDMYTSLTDKMDNLTDIINEKFDEVDHKLNILSDSNRNGIKAWLVKTYYESLDEAYVDDFTKDLIEKRFDDYKKLGGNSYIEQLVNKMRSMPTKDEYEAKLR